MNIDISKIITAESRAAQEAEARARRLKAECQTRITEMLDDNTTKNLLAAALIGSLSEAQHGVFVSGQDWVQSMIAECRRAIATGDGADWPAPPEGLAELCAAF